MVVLGDGTVDWFYCARTLVNARYAPPDVSHSNGSAAAAAAAAAATAASSGENDTGYFSSPARQVEEGGTPSQQVSPLEISVMSKSDADEDNLKHCAALPDSSSEPSVSAIDRRMLDSDYGPPEGNESTHPGGPLP